MLKSFWFVVAAMVRATHHWEFLLWCLFWPLNCSFVLWTRLCASNCQLAECISSQFSKIVTVKRYIWTELTPLTFSKMAKITVFKGMIYERGVPTELPSDYGFHFSCWNSVYNLLKGQLIRAAWSIPGFLFQLGSWSGLLFSAAGFTWWCWWNFLLSDKEWTYLDHYLLIGWGWSCWVWVLSSVEWGANGA